MTEVNLTPELRFPEFDGDWIETRTKEIAPLQRGFDLPTSNVIEGIYPVVYSNGILRYHNEFKANGPGVVTGRSGTIGKVTYVEKDFWPHNTSLWVTDFKDNIPKFIYYFYINFRLERFNAGSTVPTLNRNDVHFVKKRIPRPEEQQKIASFLTAVDERIQLLQQKKAKLEEYKKGVMQQLFSQQIRFKDENGNDFPDWEEKRLGSLTTISKGKQLNRSELTETGEYPCQNGGIDPSGYTHQYNTEANTITISEGGNSCGYVNFMETRFWCGGHCYALINIKNSVVLEFLFQSLKFNQNDLMRLRVGSGLPNIQKGDVSKFKIALPSKAEQIKIASFLTSLDASIESLVKEIEGTTTFKKGLLQKMFV